MATPVTMDDIESLIGRLVSAQISAVQAATVAGGSTREVTSLNALQVAVKLDGPATYLTWARSTRLLVQGRGLDRYLTGEAKKPTSGVSSVTQWEMENSVVLAFLLNTMEPNVAKSVQLLETAHEVWEAVAQMYSQRRNSAQEFEIRSQLRELRQGAMTVTEYATELKRLWSEADHYRTFVPTSPAEVKGFQKYLERERVQDFLYGLNSDFESVRVQLLARDDLPTVGHAFSTVLSEETRRRVSSTVSAPVRSALIVQPQTQPSGEKICHHCNKLGHIKAQCWELHGRPTQFGRGGRGRSGNGGRRGGGHGGGRSRGRTFGQAHLSEETGDSKSGLSVEEYQLLRRMLEKHEAHSGTTSSAVEAPSQHDEYTNSSHFAQSVAYKFQRGKAEEDEGPFLISLQTLKCPSSGFLVVEIPNARVHTEEVEASSQPEEKKTEYTWKIDGFSKLAAKEYKSGPFLIGDNIWNLNLYPKGNREEGKFLSLFLELDNASRLPSSEKVYADFGLIVVNQISHGNNLEKRTNVHFSSKSTSWGYASFLSLGDLHDPSKGFLVNDTCQVKVVFYSCK